MAIQLPNFNQPAEEGFLSKILQGYSAANALQRLPQQNEQLNLMNEQQQIANQFAPQRMEQENEQMRLMNALQQAREPFAQQLAQGEVESQQRANRGALGNMIQDVNNVVQQYGFNSPEAEAARQWFQGQVQGRQQPDQRTREQKLADDMSNGDPVLRAKLLKELSKVQGERRPEVPVDANAFENMQPGERQIVVKEMNADLKKANSAASALKLVKEMKKIQDSNPNLSKYFASAIVTDEPGLWSKIKRNIVGLTDEKSLAEIEKFRKLSSELVLKGSENWGVRPTDARTKLLSLTKPNENNTTEANNYLFNRLEDEFEPWVAYGEDLKKGLNNRYQVIPDFNKYVNNKEETLQNVLQQGPSEPSKTANRRKVSYKGKIYLVSEDQLEKALAQEGAELIE